MLFATPPSKPDSTTAQRAVLATFGFLMVPLSMVVVAGTLAAAGAFGFMLDPITMPIFRRLRIARTAIDKPMGASVMIGVAYCRDLLCDGKFLRRCETFA